MAVLGWGGLCQQSGDKHHSEPCCEMPGYLGDASGKMQRGNRVEGRPAAEELLGGWELWMVVAVGEGPPNALPVAPGQHKAALAKVGWCLWRQV